MKKRAIIFIIFLAVLAVGLLLAYRVTQRSVFRPTDTALPEGVTKLAEDVDITVIADGLTIPWEIAFLPGGEMLVTERPGRLLKIAEDKTVIPIDGVAHRGEGGLLGLALHPQFDQNQWLYLYLTTKTNGGLTNRVERYRFEGVTLTDRRVIIENIPGAAYHDGGRIAFGPDGYLYITTGDAGVSERAQDKNSLAGKLLRLTDDGSIPPENPFGTAVYSYGHRNSQGLCWDEQGRLWATEHGRSGVGNSGYDELNRIEPGVNYGWPVVQGPEEKSGMRASVVQSGADETWAPAGAACAGSSVFFAGLRGESLYEAAVGEDGTVSLRAHLREAFGRLRAVVIGPDGAFYISTSNQDGRGSAQDGDDKIIRIPLSVLE